MGVVQRANGLRLTRIAEVLAVMRPLVVERLEDWVEHHPREAQRVPAAVAADRQWVRCTCTTTSWT